MTEGARARLRTVARLVFTAAGVAATIVLVRHVGLDTIGALLRAALPWIPLLLALEAFRIWTEIAATFVLCGADATRLDRAQWLRFHLVANAALVILPGGRAVSEGVKIARLAPVLGPGRAAALVSVQHAATLLAIAAFTLPVALLVRSSPVLAGAFVVQGALCLGGAVGLQLAMRHAIVPRVVTRWLGPTEPVVDEVRATARALPWIPMGALGAKLANRLAQLAQIAILLRAFGGATGVEAAFVASGVNLVGSALGELSPAQVGGTEGAFAMAAGLLGIGVGAALAIATILRRVQLAWSGVGIVFSAVELIASRPRARAAESAPPERSVDSLV